jgi:hypothetical protein
VGFEYHGDDPSSTRPAVVAPVGTSTLAVQSNTIFLGDGPLFYKGADHGLDSP